MSSRRETHNTKIFAQRLAKRMEELNLTQSALSDLTGIQRQTISLYLKGKTAPVSDKLVTLAIELRCSVDWLLGLSDYRNNSLVRGSIGGLGFTDKAAIAMLNNDRIVPALNLLIETEALDLLLKALSDYYYACEADSLVDAAKEYYQITNNGKLPNSNQISLMLSNASDFAGLSNDTKSFMRVLEARYEKVKDIPIDASRKEDNVFLNQLEMRDLYELQIHKFIHILIGDLDKRALAHIRNLSVFGDDLN